MSLAGLGSTGQTQLEKGGVSVWVWIDFLSGSCGVLGRWKQEWTVVLAHAPMTPGKIEQEEHAHSVQPCAGLGAVNFQIAAVWAGVVQRDSKHYKIVLTFPLLVFPAQRFQQIHCFLVAAIGTFCHELFRLLLG
jgi:hypothetical protein